MRTSSWSRQRATVALLFNLIAACASEQSTSGDSGTGGQGTAAEGTAAAQGPGDGDGDGDNLPGDGDGDSLPGDGDGDSLSGDGDGDSLSGDGDGDGDGDGRPPLLDVVPDYFAFGYSRYSKTHDWPATVRTSRGIKWDYMYWYHSWNAADFVLGDRLAEADANGAIPVMTHYQVLERGWNAGYTGAEEWDVVTQAVQDPQVMREYFENVQGLLEESAAYGKPLIFQTEPDTTTWLRQYHTGGSNDANDGVVAVASSGHPDLADLPNTIAGYVQALVRLRDRYAPKNVYLGLCIFDNEGGWNPEDSVTFVNSLGTNVDLLFTHHVVKYSTRNEGWWDAYDESAQARFVTWIETISKATGLRYMHWQTVIGSADYGLLPNYPAEERITPLLQAGSIGNLFDLFSLEGPPHSQPWHGYSSAPPPDHPGYNSLDKLAERLGKYYADPLPIPR